MSEKAIAALDKLVPAPSTKNYQFYRGHYELIRYEITRLQSEVERLRGRLCKTCEGTGMIGGPSPSAPDEGGEPCPECNAWLLRKQAEAAKQAAKELSTIPGAALWDCEDVQDWLERGYAQRLMQQAAEIEK